MTNGKGNIRTPSQVEVNLDRELNMKQLRKTGTGLTRSGIYYRAKKKEYLTELGKILFVTQ